MAWNVPLKLKKGIFDLEANEQELIIAGYKYLQAGNAKDAAEVFKLSTEVFPDKDNPYDSYAEALRVLGKNANTGSMPNAEDAPPLSNNLNLSNLDDS